MNFSLRLNQCQTKLEARMKDGAKKSQGTLPYKSYNKISVSISGLLTSTLHATIPIATGKNSKVNVERDKRYPSGPHRVFASLTIRL
jgi:hypothetical protein